MMFEIGQQVVCIGDWSQESALQTPIRGQIYTIRGFCQQAMDEYGVAYLWFEELINPISSYRGCEPAFLSYLFRPLRKTNIEIFTKLLAPTPKQKELT